MGYKTKGKKLEKYWRKIRQRCEREKAGISPQPRQPQKILIPTYFGEWEEYKRPAEGMARGHLESIFRDVYGKMFGRSHARMIEND